MEFNHKSVLLEECIEGLNIKEDGIYVDGTLGGAGHSSKILEKLSSKGLLIGIDRDEDALKVASERLKKFDNKKLVHDNHDNIKEVLLNLDIDGVDGILLDLGVSSYQIDEASRGFSYNKDAILDMRMDKTQEIMAKDIVNNYEESRLAKIIYDYGEEKFSRQIARNICKYRAEKPIETTPKPTQTLGEKDEVKEDKNLGEVILPALLGIAITGGLLLLIAMLNKKNVEIYVTTKEGRKLIAKEKISKTTKEINLDNYKEEIDSAESVELVIEGKTVEKLENETIEVVLNNQTQKHTVKENIRIK